MGFAQQKNQSKVDVSHEKKSGAGVFRTNYTANKKIARAKHVRVNSDVSPSLKACASSDNLHAMRNIRATGTVRATNSAAAPSTTTQSNSNISQSNSSVTHQQTARPSSSVAHPQTAQPSSSVAHPQTAQTGSNIAHFPNKKRHTWHKNAVAVMLAGVLVVGTSVPTTNISPKALAQGANANEIANVEANSQVSTTDTSNGSSDGTSDSNTDTNKNTNTGDTSNKNTNSTPQNSGIDTYDHGSGSTEGGQGEQNNDAGATNNTNTNATDVNNANNTDSATGANNENKENAEEEKDYSDPEAAKPNGSFGAPTTDVVIEGSVNGEILAKIALAEADGFPAGGDYNKYNYGSGEPWCAYFVMYCARAAGLSTECIPNYPGCPMMVQYYKNINRWQPFTTKYQPHVGDLIFYSSAQGGIAEHIGIVTASTETTVTTREGNTNAGEVASHVFSTTNESGSVGNSWYILGYASPDYPAQNEHEHNHVVKSITSVSETSHVVAYSDCTVCGESHASETVSHNFISKQEGESLEEASEWVCADCGFVQPHYTTGVMASSSGIKLYDSVSGEITQEVSDNSIVVTKIEVGADGNYWGTTAGGNKVKMNQAGIKQSDKFSTVTESIDDAHAQASQISQTSSSQASATQTTQSSATQVAAGQSSTIQSTTAQSNTSQSSVAQSTQTVQASQSNKTSAGSTLVENETYNLGSDETHIKDTAYQDYQQAEAVEVAQVEKGSMYLLEIESTSSTSDFAQDSGVLGTAMCKLVYKDADGNMDTSSFRYYGENSNKLKLTDSKQRIVVAPDFDATLVLACQYGTREGANNVKFEGVTLTKLN